MSHEDALVRYLAERAGFTGEAATRLRLSRRHFIIGAVCGAGGFLLPGSAAGEVIPPQPYFASVRRALEALAAAGQPVAKVDARLLEELAGKGDAESVAAAEAVLARYTLARVNLAASGPGAALPGGASRELIEQGWRVFLIRVDNPEGSTDPFRLSSGTQTPGQMSRLVGDGPMRALIPDTVEMAPAIEKLWLLAQVHGEATLSGLPVQYVATQMFSRDRGRRHGRLRFAAGARSSEVSLDFDCLPSHDVALSIKDGDGVGCMASLAVRDEHGHVYPPQVMRIAPDMAFHPQVYRADGESLRLPDGRYEVGYGRGPEYLRGKARVTIAEGHRNIALRLERWIDPASWGWYSGDTHIHPAGCEHYIYPTEGVSPETMIRHVRGEALSIGSVLNWGPGWYHQRQFFSGKAISPPAALEHPDLQAANNATWRPKPTPRDAESLLRYDIEVSGFPSGMMGHLVLLRLKEFAYPGTREIGDWPSWTLPIHQWVRAQGGLSGVAHCGAGMETVSQDLPNHEIPPFTSVGTNEAIVDVTHGCCDFLSGVQAVPSYELNAWYHLLNCGFRLAMLGETDYPCFSGERPGIGRSYVRLERRPTDETGYGAWVEGIRAGRHYFGDGRSHFLNLAVNGVSPGSGDVGLAGPGELEIEALIAARLEPEPEEVDDYFKWHIERARLGASRNVSVELVVNGQPVEHLEFPADGKPRPVRFKTRIERSSWVAVRIMPSGHTHPFHVTVGGKPVRASRRSAEWLRACVDALWAEKHRLVRERERPQVERAFDHARRTYDLIIAESGEA